MNWPGDHEVPTRAVQYDRSLAVGLAAQDVAVLLGDQRRWPRRTARTALGGASWWWWSGRGGGGAALRTPWPRSAWSASLL